MTIHGWVFYPHVLTLEFNPTEVASPPSVQGWKDATIGTGRAFGGGVSRWSVSHCILFATWQAFFSIPLSPTSCVLSSGARTHIPLRPYLPRQLQTFPRPAGAHLEFLMTITDPLSLGVFWLTKCFHPHVSFNPYKNPVGLTLLQREDS